MPLYCSVGAQKETLDDYHSEAQRNKQASFFQLAELRPRPQSLPVGAAQLTDVDRTHRCYLYFQPISHCPRNVRLIEQTSKANHFAIGKWQARLS